MYYEQFARHKVSCILYLVLIIVLSARSQVVTNCQFKTQAVKIEDFR